MSTLSQRSFAGGEVGPPLYARVDVVKYATGLRTCRNFIVAKHGGVFNRPGTYFICEIKDSTKQAKLLPFVFNPEQTYAIEMGEEYSRFVRDGAQIGVSNYVAWSSVTSYEISDLVLEGGVYYYCIQAHSNQQPPNASYWYPLIGSIYEIPTTFLENHLFDLDYVQSADVLSLAHQKYPPRDLSRYGHDKWKLSDTAFAPEQAAPTSPSNTGAAGTGGDAWVITAINDDDFEESLPSAVTETSATASSGSPITVSWTMASGASRYNVYKRSNGIYGFIGIADGTSFRDNGIDADTSDTPPEARNPFGSAGNYPASVGYYQQRKGYAGTENKPETADFSRSGHLKNFTKSFPLQDDDAVTFTLVGQQVNAIKHILDLGKLVMLTSGGEWLIRGDSAGILRPLEVNPEQQSYEGAGMLQPIVIGNNAIFAQAQGSVIRDLKAVINAEGDIGYRGNDLTIFAPHLFEGYTIVDWAYQKTPNSIIWAVRSDGVLLGLTYLPEHQIWGWHRHDFDGQVESVCAIPEGNETALYLIIKREIDGNTKRYIERMETRFVDDIKDALFMDCALSYDGRNTNDSHTMTLSGSGWTHDDELTLTSNTGFFDSSYVGNEIHLTGDDGTVIRCEILSVGGLTTATVRPHKTVPTNMRSVAISEWGHAVDEVSGLEHIEGKSVSIFADGFAVASPNNPAYDEKTVSGGTVTLGRCYVVVHVGLPITSDIETLDIDTVNSETLSDKNMLISKATIFMEKTRGLFIGIEAPEDNGIEGLYELKARDLEGYDEPTELATGKNSVNIQSNWNNNGRVFIRQVDPVPCGILAISPAGLIPLKGAA